MAEGLAAAHAKGLIHQRIHRVKQLDFGLARSNDGDVQLTSSGMIVGTPSDMAPEQASGDPVDARADLFSLGVVLYRMTTGRPPFPVRNVMEILRSLATVTPASVKTLNDCVSSELSDVIDRLLLKDASQRLASATAVVRELRRIGDRLSRSWHDGGWTPRPSVSDSMRTEDSMRTDGASILRETRSPKGSETQPLARGGGEPTFAEFTAALSADERRGLGVGRKKNASRGTPRLRRALAAGAAVALMAIVIVTIKTKNGKKTEVAVNVPQDVTSAKARVQKEKESKGTTGQRPVATGPSPFDELDPAAIPVEERFNRQPKELVAVLGSHRQRLGAGASSVALSAEGSVVLAGGHDGHGWLFDVANGKETTAPIPSSRRVAVSPDGTMLF